MQAPESPLPTAPEGSSFGISRTARADARCTGIFRAVDSRFHYEALDAIPGHVLILDVRRADHPIVFANRATLRDYGYEMTEMFGRPFLSIVDPAAAGDCVDALRMAAAADNGDARTELQVLRRRLYRARSKWEMTFVANAALAIEQLEAKPYDVIVTEMRMARMDGAQLLEIASEKSPQTIRIVTHAISSTSMGAQQDVRTL